MDRMLRESQNKKGRSNGAKPSFILLESIRCQIDMAVSPWPAGLQQLHTPPTGAWPVLFFANQPKPL